MANNADLAFRIILSGYPLFAQWIGPNAYGKYGTWWYVTKYNNRQSVIVVFSSH